MQMTMNFKATSNGKDEFLMSQTLQKFADEFWVPQHVTRERAAEIILGAFKRKIAGELKLLDLDTEDCNAG